MKKILITFACVCSLALTSCASKPSTAPLTDSPDYPETQEELNSESQENDSADILTEDDSSIDVEENTDESNEAEDQQDTTDLEAEESTEEDDDLPELEEIEEPEIITLEPADLPEPEAIPEEPAAEEPVEVETPPVIVEAEQEDVEAATSSETAEANESTDAVDNIENTESSESTEVNDVSLVDETQDNEDVIVVTDDNDDSVEETEIKEQEEIVPSRKVTLKKMEYVDITYPGTGWIFMGLVDGSKDLTYFGRKLGTADTRFTLQAKSAGTKIVHFYKNDALTNQYIDDYIEVEILPEKGSNKTHITAPEYKQPVPKKAKEILQKKPIKQLPPEVVAPVEKAATEEPKATVPEVKETEVEAAQEEPETALKEEKNTSTPDINILLKDAEVLYNEKEYKYALEKLNTFFEHATTKLDEALYLKGQVLEAKSSVQDIKGAMEAYNLLTKNYPASKYWDNADKRIKYLRKFYFGG